MKPSIPFRSTPGRAVCLALLACMAFQVLYLAFLSGPIERQMPGELSFVIAFIASNILALIILYPSPVLAGNGRVVRVGALVLIAHGLVMGAMVGICVLWVIVCLALGIPPREGVNKGASPEAGKLVEKLRHCSTVGG